MIKAVIAKAVRTFVLSGACVIVAACASQSDPKARDRSAAAEATGKVGVGSMRLE